MKYRALCFFWGNPALVQGVAEFCHYYSREFGVEFYVITPDLPGRLMFLREGIQAFVLDDLPMPEAEADYPGVGDADAQELIRFDMLTHSGAAKACEEMGIGSYVNRVLRTYEYLADTLQARLFFLWNGATFWQRALAHVAKGKGAPCFYLERGLLPGTLVIDPNGVNYNSSLAGSRWAAGSAEKPSEEEEARLQVFLQLVKGSHRTVVPHGEDVGSQHARGLLGIPPGAKIVVLPLQLENDSNILFNSPFFRTMPQVIAVLQKSLDNLRDVWVVIKPHPEDKDRVLELSELCGPRCLLSGNLSLPSLLAIADVVVTVNSNVGFEALIQGKPVVALGRAIYTEKGFTFDIAGPQDMELQLDRALKAAEQPKPVSDDFRRFLCVLLRSHLFPIVGNDEWGSRARIGHCIVKRATKGNLDPVPPAGSRPLKGMLEQNLLLIRLLSPNSSLDQKRLLFLLTSDRIKNLVRSFAAGKIGLEEEITVSAAGVTTLPKLLRRYDLMISDKRVSGWRRVVLTALHCVVRAEQKILL